MTAGDRSTLTCAVLAIAALTIAVYLPIHHAGYFSDDRIYLHDAAWFRDGNGWREIFGGIFDSGDFFRPLVMALFAAETIVFDAAAGPAHLVSLSFHVANTVCVGLIARQLAGRPQSWRDLGLLCVAMLFFALHPLLIEPVAWISGQFDLVCTFFILVALLLNLTIRGVWLASVLVGAAFLLAACAKEAAVSLLPLLVIADWMRQPPAGAGATLAGRVRTLLAARWPVYFSVLLAGTLYLWARHDALGYLIQPAPAASVSTAPRLQLVTFTYLAYWRVLLWPMSGLGFIHPLPPAFAAGGAADLMRPVAALALFAFGLWQLVRGRALGALVIGVTAALLPVLHLLPIEIDDSFYHDRYATAALAILCVWIPNTVTDLLRSRPKAARLLAFGGTAAAALWLAAAVLNIRVTLPLWADDVLMWKWILRQNPGSTLAKDGLLDRYLVRGDLRNAAPLAEDLQRTGTACMTCMLNVANFEIASGNAAAAATALQNTRTATRYQRPSRMQMIGFILATGDVRLLEGKLPEAEAAYRDAISMDPGIPGPRMSLAYALVREGKLDAARESAAQALARFAPDERQAQRERFERALASAGAAAAPDVQSKP